MMKNKELEKKKNSIWEWLLWWKVRNEEIQEQVEKYETLSFFASARKLSFNLLLFSMVVTIVLTLLGSSSSASLLDTTTFLIIGVFIYRGHKWAMVAAMILWTIEKTAMLLNVPSNAFVQLICWSIYMHTFWLAFQVERRRDKVKRSAVN